mmetsp:Transcript_19686/g.63996  ORF Transcript_19686/g.63996 Transcript_19686/m.63996 type:complete len:351 (-) Transcript_19686:765-1817(-)
MRPPGDAPLHAVRRRERSVVKLHSRVLEPSGVEVLEHFERGVVRRRQRQPRTTTAIAAGEGAEGGNAERRPFLRARPAPHLIEEHERVWRRRAHNLFRAPHARAELREAPEERLPVPDVGEDEVEEGEARHARRHKQPRPSHERREPERFERRRLPAGVGPRHRHRARPRRHEHVHGYHHRERVMRLLSRLLLRRRFLLRELLQPRLWRTFPLLFLFAIAVAVPPPLRIGAHRRREQERVLQLRELDEAAPVAVDAFPHARVPPLRAGVRIDKCRADGIARGGVARASGRRVEPRDCLEVLPHRRRHRREFLRHLPKERRLRLLRGCRCRREVVVRRNRPWGLDAQHPCT